MINPNPTSNTLTKRESTNREYLSKASLIGLSNLYGVDFVLRIVNRNQRKVKVTVDHLMIEEMSLIVETEEEKNARKQQVSGMARNALKSYEAGLVNMMGEYLTETYRLGHQLTKPRSTVKTVKMKKYRWIDPFNEEGYRLFGSRVIEAVYGMKSESINGKHSIIRLDKENMAIYNIYCEIIQNVTMLSPQGYEMLYGVSPQVVQQQQSPPQEEQQMMIIVNPEGTGMDGEGMYIDNGIQQQQTGYSEAYSQMYQTGQESYQEYQQPVEQPIQQQEVQVQQEEDGMNQVEMNDDMNQEMYLPPSYFGDNEEYSLPPSTASITTIAINHISPIKEIEIDISNEEEPTQTPMYTQTTTMQQSQQPANSTEGQKIERNGNNMTETPMFNGYENYQMIYEWMAMGAQESGCLPTYPNSHY